MADDVPDFVRGDVTGLAIPAHPAALAGGGADWLTTAFRAFGSLAPDNRVTRIVAIEPCGGGSTGAKLFLALDYAHSEPSLPTELFVKFSRDFTDARRDSQRDELEAEARFAAVSRVPGFPIAVPTALFGDYHHGSGTGLVVTERIRFGADGIEPHRRKCLDHETLADPLPYYRALVTALARLAGADKAGRLGPDIDAPFPVDRVRASADPIRHDAAVLDGLVGKALSFAEAAPHLLPRALRDPAFYDRLREGVRTVHAHEAAIQRELTGDPAMIALCHWNAHIDNAWFRRDGDALSCGLIDWGRVGRITLGSALWGCLSAAHHSVWDDHLDELLALFVAEYRAAGGPAITAAALERHLLLHVAAMGVARVLVFPKIVLFRLPQAVDAAGPHDPIFRDNDPARNCLHVYTVFLTLWRRRITPLMDGMG